jgi:hypothetical protein
MLCLSSRNMIDNTMYEVLWRNISVLYFLKTNNILLHLSIFYEYQQFFQHLICFSIQPQLQLVNLHRKQRYFVIKLIMSVLIGWPHGKKMHVKEIYVIFIHLFDSEILGEIISVCSVSEHFVYETHFVARWLSSLTRTNLNID